jgi:hypothetical protein
MPIGPYGLSHAKVRRLMADASSLLASLTPNDLTGACVAARSIKDMLAAMRRASERETAILHPLLTGPMVELRKSLDRQHAIIEPLIVRVEGVLDHFLALRSEPELRLLQGTLHHFLEAVTPHMEGEEALAPLFARLLSPQELVIVARQLAEDG